MTQEITRRLDRPHVRPVVAGAIVAVALLYLSYWAGIPERGLTAFAIGLVALVGLTLACGVAAWWLLRPMDQPLRAVLTPSAATAAWPRVAAGLLAMATLSLTLGGFWDEVWHRKFGLPFGEDLLWRPHLLIYFGLLVPPALAAVRVSRLLRHGQGNLLEQLRGDRGQGLLIITGGFLLFAVPADPLWHIIYGEDISAWSLPHLVLMLAALVVAILGIYLQFSSVPPRVGWRWRPAMPLALVFLAGAASLMGQVLIGDFAAGSPIAAERPAWLLPALLVGMAMLLGTTANHAHRTFGVATAVGLLTLAARWALVLAFDFHEIRAADWLPWLPPLVALDLTYAVGVLQRKAPPSTTGY